MKNDETQTEDKMVKYKKTERNLLVTLVVLSIVSGAVLPFGIPKNLFNILFNADFLMAICFPAFLIGKYPESEKGTSKKIFLCLKLFFIFLISLVFFMLLGELVGVLLCYVTGQGVRTN